MLSLNMNIEKGLSGRQSLFDIHVFEIDLLFVIQEAYISVFLITFAPINNTKKESFEIT